MREQGGGNKGKGKSRALLLMSCFLFPLPCSLVGCSKNHRAGKPVSNKKPDALPVSNVGLGGGYTTVYQSDAKDALPSFSLRWKTGGLNTKNGSFDTGHLEAPQGHLFSQGRQSSAYRGDVGKADQAAKRLDLEGHVVLVSADGKQTLKAPKAEYRGDVKLVRATGGVNATGTFGTLSGVPELWATPDLRLIGTPDMVSKTLKIPALAALAAAATLGAPVAQSTQGAPYKLTEGHVGLLENLGKDGYRVTLVVDRAGTPMHLVLPDQGLNAFMDGKVILLVKTKAKKNYVESAVTESPVRAIQDATQATPTGSVVRHNEYAGPRGDYRYDFDSQVSAVDMGGPVQMSSVAKETAKGKEGVATRTITGRGDQGTLALDPKEGAKASTEMILTGNVKVDLVEVDATGARRVANTAGDRLVYSTGAKDGHLVLTGKDMKLAGDGVGLLGDISGMDTVTVLLTPKNEWTDIVPDNSHGTTTTTIHLPPQKPKTPGTKPKKKGGKP